MSIQNKDLKKQIVDISYRGKCCWISSCLTAVDIIDDIYKVKKPSDRFILSPGHCAIALYVVLEKYFGEDFGIGTSGPNAQELYDKYKQHPPITDYIDSFTASLGHGLPIAVGMALADRKRKVYCLISDGELEEGSMWEALRIAEEQKLDNLYLYCNFNGLDAMKRIDVERLIVRLKNYYSGNTIIYNTDCSYIPFLSGVKGHYKILTDSEYQECINLLT